jgi:choline dehydrogenase
MMIDLIIVGAGTAGCVLAEQLSKDGRLRVLLIEAGGNPSSPFVKIPAGFAKLFKSKLDWAFESEPQTAANGRRIFTPRGKMLGGSSNMNAQIHQWCHPADFDGWVAAGATGWGWEDAAPIFREQECWLGEESNGARGRQGPMMVSPNNHAHPLSKAFVNAARASGLGNQLQYNGEGFEGAWITEIAHKDGKRFSVYDAYLKPALGRANLEVLRRAQVLRIEIANGRATGVTVRRDGVEQSLKARGVVLAAGALASPQVLMLSGIGPAEQLAKLEIPVCFDSPEVGKNLQDHPLVPTIHSTRDTDTFKKAESPLSLLRYLLFKRGMLASNAVEAFAFTHSSGTPDTPPDIELIFVPFEWRNQGLEAPQVDAFSIASVVVAPRSRGSLRLRSANPLDAPLIDFGLLTDPDGCDAAAMVAGARLARKIATTAPLADYVNEEIFPGPTINDDAELLTRLNTQLQTVYHPTSTCRMGTDSRAVVDPQLRVIGVDGLWVADASVMPAVPRGHPNAVVAMIAYRAAKMIASGLKDN